jgi:hypothetical protein
MRDEKCHMFAKFGLEWYSPKINTTSFSPPSRATQRFTLPLATAWDMPFGGESWRANYIVVHARLMAYFDSRQQGVILYYPSHHASTDFRMVWLMLRLALLAIGPLRLFNVIRRD